MLCRQRGIALVAVAGAALLAARPAFAQCGTPQGQGFAGMTATEWNIPVETRGVVSAISITYKSYAGSNSKVVESNTGSSCSAPNVYPPCMRLVAQTDNESASNCGAEGWGCMEVNSDAYVVTNMSAPYEGYAVAKSCSTISADTYGQFHDCCTHDHLYGYAYAGVKPALSITTTAGLTLLVSGHVHVATGTYTGSLCPPESSTGYCEQVADATSSALAASKVLLTGPSTSTVYTVPNGGSVSVVIPGAGTWSITTDVVSYSVSPSTVYADVDGDGVITSKDYKLLGLLTPAPAGSPGYVASLDTDMDGDMTQAEIDAARTAQCNFAEVNNDGIVDFADYLDFVDAFSNATADGDFNGDGVVDFYDYLDFVDNFSLCP
jgi:hypothetical protein